MPKSNEGGSNQKKKTKTIINLEAIPAEHPARGEKKLPVVYPKKEVPRK